MYIPFKQQIKTTFPTTFEWLRDIKDQLVIEASTLRQVGLLRILKRYVKPKEQWRKVLPIQSLATVALNIESLQALVHLVPSCEGGHTYYFTPKAVASSALRELCKYAPADVGVKIVKRVGGKNTPFAAPDISGAAYNLVSPTHHELILVHALFASLGMGPRLYDAVEIEFACGDKHVAYILQHVEGEPCADMVLAEDFIRKIQNLEVKKLIKLINWNGYNDMDFKAPGCNGNLIQERATGCLKYVDLQNFSLVNYYEHLKVVASNAASISHFGQKSYLVGGKYLYQEIPGLNMVGKRSPSQRYIVLRDLMEQAKVSVKNKLVIDIGCNLGLMGAQYLKDGAAWLHGFDFPNVVPTTEQVLLAIGCTRFSTTGMVLSQEAHLLENMPLQLTKELPGCVISYLAIRGHIGWVRQLAEINWEFMLYEGHQEEDERMSLVFIRELQANKPCSIIASGWISDANSTPRYIAIIKADNN